MRSASFVDLLCRPVEQVQGLAGEVGAGRWIWPPLVPTAEGYRFDPVLSPGPVSTPAPG